MNWTFHCFFENIREMIMVFRQDALKMISKQTQNLQSNTKLLVKQKYVLVTIFKFISLKWHFSFCSHSKWYRWYPNSSINTCGFASTYILKFSIFEELKIFKRLVKHTFLNTDWQLNVNIVEQRRLLIIILLPILSELYVQFLELISSNTLNTFRWILHTIWRNQNDVECQSTLPNDQIVQMEL